MPENQGASIREAVKWWSKPVKFYAAGPGCPVRARKSRLGHPSMASLIAPLRISVRARPVSVQAERALM